MDIWIQIDVSFFYTLASESYPIIACMNQHLRNMSKAENRKTKSFSLENQICFCNMNPIALMSLMGLLAFFFIGGLYASPFALKQDFQVQSEYLSGLLTANGILFALWGIIIERKPRQETERWMYEHTIIIEFFLPFFLFAVSLFFVTLTALNLFSSVFALVFCSFSFFMNALLITFALYFHKFKARPSESEP